MIDSVQYWCGCLPEIEFKDETQWREHMMNVHHWTDANFYAISKEMDKID